MRFVEVKKLPKTTSKGGKRRPRHNYTEEFEAFMSMNVKMARVLPDPDEFINVRVAKDTMALAAKRLGFPFSVVSRNNEIYFVRRDI